MWTVFVDAVDQYFGFLEREYGFVIKSRTPPFVIYESQTLRLLILFDETRGNELDLVMRRVTDDPKAPISIGLDRLISFGGGPEGHLSPPTFPSNEDALREKVSLMAALLRKYGEPLLRGDLKYFDYLQEIEKRIEE